MQGTKKKDLKLHASPEKEGHLTLQIIISVRNIVCGIIRNKKNKGKRSIQQVNS
jgi:hypothetical protein